MSSPADTIHTIQTALEPYIRQREEAAYIRRVLAAHLAACLQTESVEGSLALVDVSDPSSVQQPSQDVRGGLQREYLKALQANLKARRDFEDARKEQQQPPVQKAAPSAGGRQRAATNSGSGGDDAATASDRLAEQLAALKLQKKKERLQAVIRYLDALNQKPAAAEGFLHPDEIYRDAQPLPEVPKGVVNGLVAGDGDSVKTDLKELIVQLEKSVLRAKLLLRREEKLLEETKARTAGLPENVGAGAKLHALGATRAELIAWIEQELGNATAEGADESSLERQDGGAGGAAKNAAAAGKSQVDNQLASIQQRYAQYLAARKALIQAVSQRPQPIIKPREQHPPATPTTAAPPSSAQPVITHLLSPYLENLLAVAHEQRAFIAQKAHLNVVLAKRLKDTCQVLDHLAEESHLLPSYPLPGSSSSRRKGTDTAGGLMESPVARLDATSRVKAWTFAADSAKIATLEVVAEKTEEGQLALEASMRILGEIDQLLGRENGGDPGEEGDPDASDADIWLAQGQGQKGGKPLSGRKDRDVWSLLDGNLGLINSEDDRT